MTPRAVSAALLTPLGDPAQLLAGLLFWLPGAVGLALYHSLTGPLRFLGIFCLALMLALMLPGLLGYLLRLIESQALGRRPAVPGIEAFLPFSGERRLVPLLPAAALVGLWLALAERWPLAAAWLAAALAALLLPLHAMLLAMTDAPLLSISPPGLWRLARRLWPALAWLAPAVAAAAGTLALVARAGGPGWLSLLLAVLWSLSLANLCGRLLAGLDVAAEIGIAPAELPDARAAAAATEKERLQSLSHAYGLVSRGNRDGGFAHLAAHAAAEEDPLAAELWFFDALWRWDLGEDLREVPLFYAQSLLTRLLEAGADVAAMKVMVRCLRANPRFRPHASDLLRLRAVAVALGNDDVEAALRR